MLSRYWEKGKSKSLDLHCNRLRLFRTNNAEIILDSTGQDGPKDMLLMPT
jgi:hypothetical protein